MEPAALRILDANLNRAREGLRVAEEHARMILNDVGLTSRVKAVRHELASIAAAIGPMAMLAARDTLGDVGTRIHAADEHVRDGPVHVASAALKRTGEALRCIEEYAKTGDDTIANLAKKIRYKLYTIEQDLLLAGPRRKRLAEARLHVLVTAANCRGDWLDVCKKAIAGGANVLQLREKDLPDGRLLERARVLRELTTSQGAMLFINDRVDIARLVDADGVHLGQNDLPVADARRIGGPAMLIGKSTHSAAEFRDAVNDSPDYLAVGPMFRSPTKPDVAVQGPPLLEELATISDLPIVAIGGITPQNVARLHSPRPFAVAVSHAIIAAADPAAAAAELLTSHAGSPLINKNKSPGP